MVTSCREEDNSYASFLWLWEDGRLRQLTGLGKESQFIWEDDMHLLFPAVRSKEEQKRQEAKEEFTSFYRLCVSGGEALPAFTLPFSVSQLHHISGSRYLVEASSTPLIRIITGWIRRAGKRWQRLIRKSGL